MDHFRNYEIGSAANHIRANSWLITGQVCGFYQMNNHLPRFSREQNQKINQELQNDLLDYCRPFIDRFEQNHDQGYKIERGTASGHSWRLKFLYITGLDQNDVSKAIMKYSNDTMEDWSIEQLAAEAETVMMFDSTMIAIQRMIIQRLNF
jgi:hypothetical protein